MAAATGFYLSKPVNGVRYFGVNYSHTAAAAADTLFCAIPEALYKEALGGIMVVTNAEVQISSAAGGIKLNLVYVAAPTPVYLEYKVSVNTTETIVWNNINAACSTEAFSETAKAYWGWLGFTTATAGDTFGFALRGFIITPEDAMPVSVEGYKWPLQRRY